MRDLQDVLSGDSHQLPVCFVQYLNTKLEFHSAGFPSFLLVRTQTRYLPNCLGKMHHPCVPISRSNMLHN